MSWWRIIFRYWPTRRRRTGLRPQLTSRTGIIQRTLGPRHPQPRSYQSSSPGLTRGPSVTTRAVTSAGWPGLRPAMTDEGWRVGEVGPSFRWDVSCGCGTAGASGDDYSLPPRIGSLTTTSTMG